MKDLLDLLVLLRVLPQVLPLVLPRVLPRVLPISLPQMDLLLLHLRLLHLLHLPHRLVLVAILFAMDVRMSARVVIPLWVDTSLLRIVVLLSTRAYLLINPFPHLLRLYLECQRESLTPSNLLHLDLRMSEMIGFAHLPPQRIDRRQSIIV
jgi:hypothetical protein